MAESVAAVLSGGALLLLETLPIGDSAVLGPGALMPGAPLRLEPPPLPPLLLAPPPPPPVALTNGLSRSLGGVCERINTRRPGTASPGLAAS
nr:hypothetical protein HUO10_005767 [Paraburkholderia busanensis]